MEFSYGSSLSRMYKGGGSTKTSGMENDKNRNSNPNRYYGGSSSGSEDFDLPPLNINNTDEEKRFATTSPE